MVTNSSLPRSMGDAVVLLIFLPHNYFASYAALTIFPSSRPWPTSARACVGNTKGTDWGNSSGGPLKMHTRGGLGIAYMILLWWRFFHI